MLQSVNPSLIFHLAAFSIPRLSWSNTHETMDTNVNGTLNILDVLRKKRITARLVFASTNLVYGNAFLTARGVTEKTPLSPLNPYAASKALAEYACLNFVSRYGIDAVIARPFNHLGVGQKTKLVFSDWTRQIVLAEKGHREAVLNTGNLDAYREFLHVEDVCHAYALLAEKGKTGEVYNICTGRVVRLSRYIEYLLSRSRIKIRQKTRADRLRTDDPRRIEGSGTKIRSLGWKPEKDAFKALDDLLEHWRKVL